MRDPEELHNTFQITLNEIFQMNAFKSLISTENLIFARHAEFP